MTQLLHQVYNFNYFETLTYCGQFFLLKIQAWPWDHILNLWLQILLFFFVQCSIFSKLGWFNPLVAWWWYPGLFHGLLIGAWSFVVMKDFIYFSLLCRLQSTHQWLKTICDFAHTDLEHALKMSRFYLFFITLHNLNQQNRQFKFFFYFVHTDLETGSFINICDIENLTNFATKKMENLVKFTLEKKIPKTPILLF